MNNQNAKNNLTEEELLQQKIDNEKSYQRKKIINYTIILIIILLLLKYCGIGEKNNSVYINPKIKKENVTIQKKETQNTETP